MDEWRVTVHLAVTLPLCGGLAMLFACALAAFVMLLVRDGQPGWEVPPACLCGCVVVAFTLSDSERDAEMQSPQSVCGCGKCPWPRREVNRRSELCAMYRNMLGRDRDKD